MLCEEIKFWIIWLPDIFAPSRPIAACEDRKYVFIALTRHVDISSKVHHEKSPEEKEKKYQSSISENDIH